MLVQDPAAQFLVQLPVNTLEKAGRGWTECLASTIHVGDQEGALGSWFWIGLGLAVVTVWEVIRQNISLLWLSLSL